MSCSASSSASTSSCIRSKPELRDVYGVVFWQLEGANVQRNVAVFADGEVDRSPCGSGTSARLALLDASGDLTRGDELRHLSIVGSEFRARVVGETEVAGRLRWVSEVERAPPTAPASTASCSRTRTSWARGSSCDNVASVSEVETTRDGAVLTITLNRPDVLNAFNGAMHKALGAALKEARDPAVRAVVLTGAGRGFCVGQDLTEFRDAAGDIGDRLHSTYHPNVLAIRALEKPVIAAVNGAAAGAGMSFACACDLRIASDAAVFVPAFVNIGLVPDPQVCSLSPVCSATRVRLSGCAAAGA